MEAVSRFEATGDPQRLFCAFWYRADSWPAQRWVVVKCEANSQGTNRRAVVTNRPGAFVLPSAAYDEYADRGESENRNKELKVWLASRSSQRPSLLCQPVSFVPTRGGLQSAGSYASPDRRSTQGTSEPRRARGSVDWIGSVGSDITADEKHDPLGEGQPCTWRTRLIKVAACVYETTRRVDCSTLIQLALPVATIRKLANSYSPAVEPPSTAVKARNNLISAPRPVTRRLGGKGGLRAELDFLPVESHSRLRSRLQLASRADL